MPAAIIPHHNREPPPPPLQLSTFQGHSDHARVFDYTQKYPVDKEGKELEHDSRTWKVYIDEHESYDYDMVKGFRDSIDALLVFAALFSSVVTGFVVPAAERLEPDSTQINTSILFEATQLLRANGNATLIAATPQSELHPDSVTHTSEDVWVACLFFLSLSLSLATAFLSILAKQWLQAFTSLVPGDAKQRSLTRQFRFGGFQRWKFSEIVGFLPLLLHLALALFLAGLCVYVNRYPKSIVVLVGSVACATLVFYVVTAALPAVHIDCPYRIPILYIPASACLYAWKMLQFAVVHQLWIRVKRLMCSFFSRDASGILSHDHVSQPSFPTLSLPTQEREYVSQNIPRLELSSLEWLYTQTTNASVQRIVLLPLARVLRNYIFNDPVTGEVTVLPPPSLPLADMRSFALAIINSISGSEPIGDDIPQLLDFYLHSSHLLGCEIMLSQCQWPSLIQSPHLQSFLDRRLLPLSATFSVETGAGRCEGHPLHMACYLGRWDIVGWLAHNCLPSHLTMEDSDGWLPMGRLADSHDISLEDWGSIVDVMIWRKVDVCLSPVNRDGDTPLHILCMQGAKLAKVTPIVRSVSLLRNVERGDGKTPLHMLCEGEGNLPQRCRIAEYLFAYGANLSISDAPGWTPLHLATFKKSAELVQVFCSHLKTLKNGPNVVNQFINNRKTALHIACSPFIRRSAESLQIVETLISASADPNLGDNDKNLPLHIACTADSIFDVMNLDIVVILLGNTLDINTRNDDGHTPLDKLMMWTNSSEDWQKAYDLMHEKGAKLGSELEVVEYSSSSNLAVQ